MALARAVLRVRRVEYDAVKLVVVGMDFFSIVVLWLCECVLTREI